MLTFAHYKISSKDSRTIMKKLISLILTINICSVYAVPYDLWVEKEKSNERCDVKVDLRQKDWLDYPKEICYGKCKDGTFSSKQAPSEGNLKQEGMCGQTSIINIIEMSCGISLSNNLVNEFVRDNTPGVSPSTFKTGINDITSTINKINPSACDLNKFQRYNSASADDFVADLYLLLGQGSGPNMVKRKNSLGSTVDRSPVAVFVQNPNRGLFGAHWVTVVDIEDFYGECTAIVNHWGHQFKVPCDDLAEMARKGIQYPTVGAFTMISEKGN